MSVEKGSLVVLAAWFVFTLLMSLGGVLGRDVMHAPIPLGVAAVLPIIVFFVWYWNSPAFQRLSLSLDLRKLTLAQTWRVTGFVFIILYCQRYLPGVFALPAGLGDMAIGITAPVVASMLRAARFPKNIFVLWNVLGMLDMVMAVSLGVLASLPFFRGEITTRHMGEFPLSMIPGFFVPLFLILHLIALIQVRQRAVRGLGTEA